MAIEIIEVNNKKELKEFVKLPFRLYKGNSYFVPPLLADDYDTFSKTKNPAFRVNDARFFVARKDNEIVGRIVAINNKPANLKWNTQNLRFSWIEMTEDYEVAKALIGACEKWGRELGLKTITGPHGFCDFDQQGMLVEGFDQRATIASFYHHPYYHEFLEKYGFTKDVDYVEILGTLPTEGVPPKLAALCQRILEKNKFSILNYSSVKQYKARGNELFALLEESFEENYGTVPLTTDQVAYYIKKYISYIHKDFIRIVVDENDVMVGFMITMPNLSRAVQKANGHLLPFGVFHILKDMRKNETLDFYFAGIKKEHRGKGIDILLSTAISESAHKFGIRWGESNQELEHNTKIQALWKYYNPILHKRRRIYKKNIY